MADESKMSLAQFAQKIKSNHPEYNQLDDQELANRVLAKFPQYREHVDLSPATVRGLQPQDSGVSPAEAQQANRTNHYEAATPSSPPPRLANFEPSKLERMAGSAMDTVLGAPSWAYHSIVDPPTPEEKASGQNSLEVIPERLLGGEQTARALQDYGAGKVSPKAAMSVLPEALGTGLGGVATGKAVEHGLPAISDVAKPVREFAQNRIYQDMPPSGKGPQLTPFAKKTAQIGGGAVGAAVVPSPLRYEGAVGGYLAGPEMLKKFAGEPELGSTKNPGMYSKIPLRVPKGGGDVPETTTGDAPTPESNAPPSRSFPRPLRPLIGSPEEWQIRDNQMRILQGEAKDAGMYSAARGGTRNIPDYQIRIGRTLNPYGGEPTEPVDLQDTDLLPRKKTSGQ